MSTAAKQERFTPNVTASIPEDMHRKLALLAMDYSERKQLDLAERVELLGMIGYPPEG